MVKARGAASPRGRLRGCLLNLTLLAAAGLVTLGAVELVLRYAAHGLLPGGEWLSTASIFRSREAMGVGLKPGSTRLLVTGGAYTARDRINAKGMRGPLPAPEPRPGRRRILVLGDSFVFGQGVPVEAALPAILERRLEGAEVINAGIPGYTLGQEYVFYREELRKLKPDLVLLGFFMNDINETRYLRLERDVRGVPVRYVLKEDAELRKVEASRPGPASRVSTWLKSHSILYTLVRNRLDNLRYRAAAGEETGGAGVAESPETPTYLHIFRSPPPQETMELWSHAWSTLDALAALVREDGARLALFYIPADWQVSGEAMARWARYYGVPPEEVDRRQPQRMLAEWAGGSGVPFVDLLPAFEGIPREETYFLHDLHWNERGHEIAAEALMEALRSQGLL